MSRIPPEVLRALDRFRRRLRLHRALGGVGITVLTGAALFGLAVELDRALVLPGSARAVLTAGTVAGTGLAALFSIVLPLLAPLPALRVARGIEAALPSLEERLITTLELAEESPPPGASRSLIEALARSTAGRLRGTDVRRLLSAGASRIRLLAGASALLALLLYAASDFRSFGLLSSRFLHPGMDLERPSRVGLEVLPGNAVLGIDDDFLVIARLTRGSPSEVSIRSRVPGGEWREAIMEPAPSAPLPFRHEFRRARQTFEYQVLAGDAASAVHRVEVRERPRPESFTVTYHFPAYTRRPPSTVNSPRGELSALVGSTAFVTALSSGRPVAARLLVAGSGPGSEVALPIEPAPGGALSDDHRVVRARIDIVKNGSYRLFLADEDGVSNRSGDAYPIHAQSDRSPRVRVLSPRTAEVVVEDGSRLEIRYQAEDDFAVEELTLVSGSADPTGAPESPRPPGERRLALPGGQPEAARSMVSGSYLWDLAPLDLEPGESMPFRLEGRDSLGQVGKTPELVLRVAFLPDPPEGAKWLSGLRDLDRGLGRVLEGWPALLGRPGGEKLSTLAPDAARSERFRRASEELLGAMSALRGVAQAASALGRSIPIPSVNREALGHLGMSLRRFTEEEGKALWTELLAASGAILEARKAGKDAPATAAAPLQTAYDRSWMRLSALVTALRTIHRAERLESALDRVRSLLDSEEGMAVRVRGLPPRGRAGDGEEAWAAASRIQRVARVEATSLGGELEMIALQGGEPDPALLPIARGYQGDLGPAVESAKAALEAGDQKALPPALEAAIRALRDAEAHLRREGSRWEAAARESRSALGDAPPLSRRVAALAASEASALEALEKGGLSAVPAVSAGDAARREEALRLRAELDARAEALQEAEPSDFESTGDVIALRDIFKDLAGGGLEAALRRTEEVRLALADPGRDRKPEEDLRSLLIERRRAAEVLSGLARALLGIEPGVALGKRARGLEAIAEAEEALAWRLRTIPPSHRRALRAFSGVARELSLALLETGAALETLGKGLPAGTAVSQSMASALAEIAPAAAASREAEARAREGKPPAALEATLEAARRAAAAARRVDEGRSGLPDLEAARAWIQRRLGSLPERVERLAREERAHGAVLEALCAELDGGPGAAEGAAEGEQASAPPDSISGAALGPVPPLQLERVASVGLDQEALRGEAARLAAAVAREGGRLSSSAGAPSASSAAFPGGGSRSAVAAGVRRLDAAADRILEISRGEMLRASRAIEGASLAPDALRQRKLLAGAAVDEEVAAGALSRVADSLRLLEEREATALAASELEALLAAAAPSTSDPRTVERALEEARLLLAGVLRAAEALSIRLPEGVLKAELLDSLRGAAEKFRGALEAGASAGERAAELVAEGRALLGQAIALARRIREEAEAALDRAELAAGRQNGPDKAPGPFSRELREVQAELERLEELRDRQAKVQAELDELLREGREERMSAKLAELAKLDQALAEELDAGFLTASELVELVADLLAAGNEGRRIAAAERRLRAELESMAGDRRAVQAMAARQEPLLGEAEAMAKKVKSAGINLTINLPAVLKPFREAEVLLGPSLKALLEAREALAAGEAPAARGPLEKAASGLESLADRLAAARIQALKEIAEREEGGSSVDFGRMGMEEALSSLRQAARDLAQGRPEAAQSLQQSASRGMLSAAQALRARLQKIRMGEEGGLLSPLADGDEAVPGLSWEVLLRGDEPAPDGTKPGDAAGEDALYEAGDGFPEEYRELVRIYLRALAET